MLLIGSRAANHWFPNFRTVRDWDILAEPEELPQLIAEMKPSKFVHAKACKVGLYGGFGKCELEVASDKSSTEALLRLKSNVNIGTLFGRPLFVPAPQVLMAIKRSHVMCPPHWVKNIEDYHFFKQQEKCCLPLATEEWVATSLRGFEACQRQDAKVKLNSSNEEFFAKSNKAIGRVFAHDDIHKLVAFDQDGIPWFIKLKRDVSKAKLDRDMFEALTFQQKLQVALEEVYAIASERRIVPAVLTDQAYDVREAYAYALKRVSTTLTKGWFRDFMLENYPSLKDDPYCYVFAQTVVEAVTNNSIAKLQESV